MKPGEQGILMLFCAKKKKKENVGASLKLVDSIRLQEALGLKKKSTIIIVISAFKLA